MDSNKDYIHSDDICTSDSNVWDDMVSGKVYDATHPFLLERLNATKDRIWEYNSLKPSMMRERSEILCEFQFHRAG